MLRAASQKALHRWTAQKKGRARTIATGRDVVQRVRDSAEESRDYAKNCRRHGPLYSRAVNYYRTTELCYEQGHTHRGGDQWDLCGGAASMAC